jgi:hypothetical protein
MPPRPRITFWDASRLNYLPLSARQHFFLLLFTILGERIAIDVNTPVAILIAIPLTLLAAYSLWIALVFLLAIIQITPIGGWIAQRRDERAIRKIKHRIDRMTTPPRVVTSREARAPASHNDPLS